MKKRSNGGQRKTVLFVMGLSALLSVSLLGSGCKSCKSCCGESEETDEKEVPAAAPAAAAAAAPAASMTEMPAAAPVVPANAAIRIKAGAFEPFKDASGNVWMVDQGFDGGETVERSDIEIANTTEPALYRSERYSMTEFTWPLANGKYLVKLHFAETFEDIVGPGQRVFSFKVQGREFKDLDLWVKAGGARRAYVESVETEITNGKLRIEFIANIENPQINAIEIIPLP